MATHVLPVHPKKLASTKCTWNLWRNVEVQ